VVERERIHPQDVAEVLTIQGDALVPLPVMKPEKTQHNSVFTEKQKQKQPSILRFTVGSILQDE
jgi:hypothetical protein